MEGSTASPSLVPDSKAKLFVYSVNKYFMEETTNREEEELLVRQIG